MRSAVSCAYYAAFCHARNYARQALAFVPSYSARDHAAVTLHLITRGRSQAANDLDQLRIWRNCCDYEDGVALLPVVALAALSKAREVIATLV